MLESRISTKLRLDENKIKLQMKYNAVLLGQPEKIYINDDEDVGVYIFSGENNRSIWTQNKKRSRQSLQWLLFANHNI